MYPSYILPLLGVYVYYMKSSSGFKLTKDKPFYFNKVIYLGRCTTNGDIFAAYKGEDVSIYKGHLNSGKY